MGKTSIEWCHYTFNPWIGCTHVSPGCEHCYAEGLASRVGGTWVTKGWRPSGQAIERGKLAVWGQRTPRLFAPGEYLQQPHAWNRAAESAGERRRVFVASMADPLELHADSAVARLQHEYRAQLWQLLKTTPALDWLLLTKRPENAKQLLPVGELPNLWLGVTAEDQRRVDERIPILLQLPAVKRFVSYEPALSAIELRPYLSGPSSSLEWIIAGAESGPRARPADLDWFRSVRDQCTSASVAFFLKQLIVNNKKRSTPALDGERWTQVPQSPLPVRAE